MAQDSTTVTISKPEPLFQRALTLDCKAFFKSLGKITLRVAAGQWAEALAELPEAVAAVGIDDKPEDRAWILIRRALARAIMSLLREFSEVHRLDSKPKVPAKDSGPDASPAVFELTSDFFLRPEKSDVIAQIRPHLLSWLIGLDIPEPRARNLCDRLPSYFAAALNAEWRSNPKFYASVRDLLATPFTDAAQRQESWRDYSVHIAHLIDEPVFGESFSLRQIYIELRASIPERLLEHSQSDREKFEAELRKDRVVTLTEHLVEWVSNRDKDDSVRVISGGPGSGKSSFSKMLANRLCNELDKRVLYIPLHQIDLRTDFVTSVGNLTSEEGFFRQNPIAAQELTDPIVLVLDGLDELEMQGRAAQEVAQDFIQNVVRTVDRINAQSCNVQVIFTGRELIVQSAEGTFRRRGEIIRMLPYFIPENERGRLLDPHHLVPQDQRDAWWKRYGELTGTNYDSIPRHLTKGEIGEVTAQPLLNYLVALSYGRGVAVSKHTNINQIYGDLVEAVYERAWARRDHPALKDVSEDAFKRLLEEVTLAIWHGDGRTTTVREIEEHCEQSRVTHLLPAFQQGVSTGVAALLLAFYFRQKGRRGDGDKTFEFTHKSFGEYLASLRIVRAIEQITQKMKEAAADPDAGWRDDEALYRWLTICGPTVMDRDLLAFIRREIAVIGKSRARVAQEGLTKLYNAFLRNNWPMERVPGKRFKEQQRFSRNAEEALFACLNACALVSRQLTEIVWSTSTAFGDALKRMQGQRDGPANSIALDCLSYLALDRVVLDMADLFGADLRRSKLRGSMLHFAMLMRADFSNADLSGATLTGANMHDVTVRGARFVDADLREVRISRPPKAALRDAIASEQAPEELDLEEAKQTEEGVRREIGSDQRFVSRAEERIREILRSLGARV